MQRQKEAVALATAQNRILQQQCKFFSILDKKIRIGPKFVFFLCQNLSFHLFEPKFLVQ